MRPKKGLLKRFPSHLRVKHAMHFARCQSLLPRHLSVTASRQLVPNQQVRGPQPPSGNEVSQQRLAPPDFSTYISMSTQISEAVATTSCKSSGDVIWIVTSLLSTGMSYIFQSSQPQQHSDQSFSHKVSLQGRRWSQVCRCNA